MAFINKHHHVMSPLLYMQQGDRYIGNAANELENINDYFYPLSQPALLYTANNDQTIFNNSSQRSNVVLIFHNQTSAWYRGDLPITFQRANDQPEQTIYKNIFWMSDIQTKKLRHLYFPAIHLPVITQRTASMIGRPAPVTSEIVQTHVLSKGILFQQNYTYYLADIDEENNMSRQIQLIYMIDTQSTRGSLALLEARGLPQDVMTKLINERNLTALDHFMTQQASTSSAGAQFSSIRSTHANIAQLILPQTITTISIGNNRLIWPLANSLDGVMGNVIANIDSQILNNTQYFVTLVSAIKGEDIEDNHYFWSVTEPDNHHQFYKLYRQKGEALAQEVSLNNFGLLSADVLSITGIHQGVAISMKNGHSYHFTLDLIEQEQLSLHSLGKAWQILYQNWLPILKMYLGQFKEQTQTRSLFGNKQKKTIHIASILSITDLLHSDGQTALPVWYDTIANHLFIKKAVNLL
ncbi:hypothetical protein Rin_00018150 [Candidatus Regiella insecticola 5.15]|uniref:Uncharacterized protein n=1 Tax=Candidatus Regiella insecticola 5.15 TaxID=1005043 RepID=G2H177_9ENTR|nr:hypothetical protein [Candidatus Regiella insecticola]EGY28253.1 hypothetical protein Rin_00018150 [Candidatus Regiella insecticola 5.15]